MVICDFDFVGIFTLPPKTNSVPIIDANAVLIDSISLKSLELISGRDCQFTKLTYPVELSKFASHHWPKRHGTCSPCTAAIGAVEKIRCGRIRE
jgi:hypothetical protein